jgi:hypothetical protein
VSRSGRVNKVGASSTRQQRAHAKEFECSQAVTLLRLGLERGTGIRIQIQEAILYEEVSCAPLRRLNGVIDALTVAAANRLPCRLPYIKRGKDK